jgi:hypothetical protein
MAVKGRSLAGAARGAVGDPANRRRPALTVPE